MMQHTQNTYQHGYVLTALLIFMVVLVVIATTTVSLAISNLKGESYFEDGNITLLAADSGAENAILRLLRDPAYSGESFQIDGTDVAVSVEGVSPQVITVVADSGAFERTVQVTVDRVEGMLQVLSWDEL